MCSELKGARNSSCAIMSATPVALMTAPLQWRAPMNRSILPALPAAGTQVTVGIEPESIHVF